MVRPPLSVAPTHVIAGSPARPCDGNGRQRAARAGSSANPGAGTAAWSLPLNNHRRLANLGPKDRCHDRANGDRQNGTHPLAAARRLAASPRRPNPLTRVMLPMSARADPGSDGRTRSPGIAPTLKVPCDLAA